MTNPVEMPPVKLAFIIDGQVVDVLHTDDRLAAIMLSQPTIVDVTDTYNANEAPFNMVSWAYDPTSNEFTAP